MTFYLLCQFHQNIYAERVKISREINFPTNCRRDKASANEKFVQ